MTDIPHKHHYIPVFYLKGFTSSGTEDGSVWVIDMQQPKQWKSTPRGAGYERDFYMSNEDREEPDSIEIAFAESENSFAPIVREVIETRTLPEGGKFSILLEFVATLASRVPAMFRIKSDWMTSICRLMIETALGNPDYFIHFLESKKEKEEDITKFPHPNKLLDKLAKGDIQLEANKERLLYLMIRDMENIYDLLTYRRWSLLIAESNLKGFICSDRPVSLCWKDSISSQQYPPGFGMRNTELTVPTSRHLALLGICDDKENTIDASENLIAEINHRTIKYAERFIYSAHQNFISHIPHP